MQMPKMPAWASGKRSRRRWRQRRAGYPGPTERRRYWAFRARRWSPGSARSASTSTSSSRSSGSANAEHLHACAGNRWAATAACGNGSRIARQLCMPMIDLYAVADLFPAHADRQLAEELTLALLKAEGVEKPGPTHLNNTGAYIHRMPPSAVNTAAAGAARTVRVQVLTPPGVLQRAGQKQLVAEITRIVPKVSGDPTQAARTWVLLTEAAEGGWGLPRTPLGKEEFAALAARAKAKP